MASQGERPDVVQEALIYPVVREGGDGPVDESLHSLCDHEQEQRLAAQGPDPVATVLREGSVDDVVGTSSSREGLDLNGKVRRYFH